MIRIGLTILMIVAWHFPTTFFAPAMSGDATGSLIWPFGRLSAPTVGSLGGVLAPNVPTALTQPSLAMIAGGVASLAFILAIASLWGIVVPHDWWRTAAIVGAVASAVLFALYVGPWAVLPIAVDAIVLWGVLVAGWSNESLTI